MTMKMRMRLQGMKTKSDVAGRMSPFSNIYCRATCLGLATFLTIVPAALIVAPAHAAAPATERVVQGEVTSKTGAPVNGAIVYLKDSKTTSVKTYITDAAGHYRFGQLSQNVDYEIWAESNGERSKTRSISSFDSRDNFNFAFRIEGK